jgi:hypothetical protein
MFSVFNLRSEYSEYKTRLNEKFFYVFFFFFHSLKCTQYELKILETQSIHSNVFFFLKIEEMTETEVSLFFYTFLYMKIEVEVNMYSRKRGNICMTAAQRKCVIYDFSLLKTKKKKLSKIEIVTDQTDERKLYSKAYMLEIIYIPLFAY